MTKRVKVTSSLDRDHFTYDVLSVFRKYDQGIMWMEAHTKYLYVKCINIDQDKWDSILKEIHNVPDVLEVEEVDLIGLEENAIEMDTIMDSSDKAFIIIRPDGKIKYLNIAATKILEKERMSVIGISITDLIDDMRLRDVFEQKPLTCSAEIDFMLFGKFFTGKLNSIMSEENTLTAYFLELDDVSRMSKKVRDITYDSSISFEDIIYRSDEMKSVIANAKRFALTDSSVLIIGESGTGKELFTRSIHNMSNRKNGPFIALNCASIPEQLLESELFGYADGAFTGGRRGGKPGILEMANGGTVFLDEIAEMAPHLQSKLLRVLQEMKVRRIGSADEVPIDVRFISATNREIEDMVAAGKFRLDLLYRINTLSLYIPPLRERPADVIPLVNYFASSHSRRYGKPITAITNGAYDMLLNYEWPGNVRELQNVVERAVALTNSNTIDESLILLSEIEQPYERKVEDFSKAVELFEIKLIRAALNESQSVREAAKRLNITHTMLLNRMKKYKIVKK